MSSTMSPPLTAAHYVLLVISGLLFSSYLLGFLYLLHREKQKKKRARERKFKDALKRRRKAISGYPKRPGITSTITAQPSDPSSPAHTPATAKTSLSEGFLDVDPTPASVAVTLALRPLTTIALRPS